MQYTGANGLYISRMTLGTVQLGMPYGIANTSGQPDDAVRTQLLQAALQGGINSFDTANSYGDSERVLGDFFANVAANVGAAADTDVGANVGAVAAAAVGAVTAAAAGEKLVFVSKMRLIAEGHTTEAELERQMYRAVELSLERLRTRCIPIMLIHTPDVLFSRGRAVIAVLKKLKAQGLIRRAGVSLGTDSERFPDMWPILKDDVFEAVQVPVNVLDHRLLRSGAVSALRQANKTVFARSIFLQGLLHLSSAELKGNLSAAERWLQVVHDIADREGLSVPQLAVSFVRDIGDISSLVIGAETAAQVRTNLAWMDGPPIGEASRLELDRAMCDVPPVVVNPALWNG